MRAASERQPRKNSQAKATLTAQYARKLLVYDAETGVLTWRVKASNRVNKGDRTGCMRWDYRAIRVDGGLYLEHRVIWLLVTGAWPEGVVAHVNGDGHDNRWCNLLHVTNRRGRWQEAA
jgi:hypothetical protein